MLEDMVHPQEHLQIDEIIDNIGLQIFDFSDTELSFPETLNIASTFKQCDEDQSSHQTQSSTPTTDKLNNNNNSIGRSFTFADPPCNNTASPSFSTIDNNYDHFQEPLRDDALDETLYSCSEELLTRIYGNNGEDRHHHETACLSTLMMMPPSSSSYISLGNYSCDVNDPLMASFNVPLISGILSGNDSVVNGADFAVRGDNYNINNCNNDHNYDGEACWLSDPVMGVFSSSFNDHQFHSTPSPSTPISSVDEPNFEVTKLSPEERKRKIDRYINKRNQRNFSKKIKYACRKTLADSRPRVRGRFVKNEELVEFAKTNNNIIMGSSSNNDDEAYENHASTLFPDHPLPEYQHKAVVKVEDRDISDILGNFASNGDQKLKSGAELNKWIMDFVMS